MLLSSFSCFLWRESLKEIVFLFSVSFFFSFFHSLKKEFERKWFSLSFSCCLLKRERERVWKKVGFFFFSLLSFEEKVWKKVFLFSSFFLPFFLDLREWVCSFVSCEATMAMASGMLRCFNCTSIAGGKKHKRSSTRETVAKCATLSCQISRYVDPGVSSTFAAGLHHQLASSSQVDYFSCPLFSLSRLLLSLWRCLKRGFVCRCLAVMNYGCSRIADSLSLCRLHIRGRFETKLMLLFGFFSFFSSARIGNFCCLIEQTEQQMLCVFSFVFPFIVYSLSFFSNWFVYRFTC